MTFQNVTENNVHFLMFEALQYFDHAIAGMMEMELNINQKNFLKILFIF